MGQETGHGLRETPALNRDNLSSCKGGVASGSGVMTKGPKELRTAASDWRWGEGWSHTRSQGLVVGGAVITRREERDLAHCCLMLPLAWEEREVCLLLRKAPDHSDRQKSKMP